MQATLCADNKFLFPVNHIFGSTPVLYQIITINTGICIADPKRETTAINTMLLKGSAYIFTLRVKCTLENNWGWILACKSMQHQLQISMLCPTSLCYPILLGDVWYAKYWQIPSLIFNHPLMPLFSFQMILLSALFITFNINAFKTRMRVTFSKKKS